MTSQVVQVRGLLLAGYGRYGHQCVNKSDKFQIKINPKFHGKVTKNQQHQVLLIMIAQIAAIILNSQTLGFHP